MILDKVLHGVLDQGRGCLIIFDKPEEDVRPGFLNFLPIYIVVDSIDSPPSLTLQLETDIDILSVIQGTYESAIQTVAQVGKVVDSLYEKVNDWPWFRFYSDSIAYMTFSRQRRLHDLECDTRILD